MQKMFEGNIVSLKMGGTAVVKVERKVAHPLYKKLMKRSKKYKADVAGLELQVGDRVRIGEVKPISKDKHFIVLKKV